ncbi:hypothetical protein HTZ85_26230 [Escherichia coli]|nr:hypothetical protein [Escherichia coli]
MAITEPQESGSPTQTTPFPPIENHTRVDTAAPRMCTVTVSVTGKHGTIYNNWLTVNGEPGERFQLPVAAEILRDQNKGCRWWLLRSFFISLVILLLSSLCYFVIQTES